MAHPSGRWRTGDGDVTTEAHEDAAGDPTGDAGGGPIGRQRLGGRSEVEADTTRDANGEVGLVELHVLVARHPTQRPGRRGRARLDLGQVGVVAECGDGVADGGVDGAAAPLGRVQRDRERVEEQRAHGHRPAGVGVQRLQLRVSPEPAAGAIDGGELGRQQFDGCVSACGLLDHDGGGGAEGRGRSASQGGLENVGRLPHREVPPDVTVGDEELDVGAWEEVEEDEEVPVFPVFPVVPVFPEASDVPFEVPLPSSEVALLSSVVVTVVDPDVEVGVELPAELAPGRSCATTNPTATVAPVAAMIAPRVRTRRRESGSVPLGGCVRLGLRVT